MTRRLDVLRPRRSRWLLVALVAFLMGTSAPVMAATPSPAPSSGTAAPTVSPPGSAVTSTPPTVGSLSVTPAKGTDLVAFSVITSKPCPTGTNMIARIVGPGLGPLGQNVMGNTDITVLPRTVGGGYFLPSSNTLRALLDQLPDPPTLKGTYQVRALCVGPVSPVVLAQFSGSMVFDGHHGYIAHDPDVPAASLATIPAGNGPPMPSGPSVGPTGVTSAAPTVAPAATGAAVHLVSGGHRGGHQTEGPWLIAIGGIAVLGGVFLFIRERRRPKPVAT